MVVVIVLAELAYREGEILREVDAVGQLALLAGIFVTAIYVIGLVVRRKWRVMGVGVDSILVMAVYLASLYGFYALRP